MYYVTGCEGRMNLQAQAFKRLGERPYMNSDVDLDDIVQPLYLEYALTSQPS